MSSKRKASTKSRQDRSVPDRSCSQHNDVAPEVEFAEHSVDPEEADAYWAARGEGPAAVANKTHPFFGTMTDDEWGKLHYVHLDHHFAQFGV